MHTIFDSSVPQTQLILCRSEHEIFGKYRETDHHRLSSSLQLHNKAYTVHNGVVALPINQQTSKSNLSATTAIFKMNLLSGHTLISEH